MASTDIVTDAQLQAFAVDLGSEFKKIDNTTGSLAALSTTAKTSLVAAINEVNAKEAPEGGVQINDAAANESTTWSGSKINTEVAGVAAKVGTLASLSTSAKTSLVAAVNELDAEHGTLSSLTTTAKTSLAAAINEVNGKQFAAVVNDAVTNTTNPWSGSKTNTAISSAVSGLVASSPAALDTLKELATALGDDPSFASTMSAALGNRVRVDAAQSFTGPQQAQGRSNIGITISTTDFVAVFQAAR